MDQPKFKLMISVCKFLFSSLLVEFLLPVIFAALQTFNYGIKNN